MSKSQKIWYLHILVSPKNDFLIITYIGPLAHYNTLSLKKVQVCKNRSENVEATSNNMTYTFFEKNAKSRGFFIF